MPPGAPRALRSEFQVDPIGLGTARPRLFWKLDDERPGAGQSAYRVLVASDPERLAEDRGDLWDSGEVASDQCTHVVYQGAVLRSRDRAFWKVRSSDTEGEPSPWSATASFELGLLTPSEWTARWIASPITGAPTTSPPVPALRRAFQVEAEVARARLYVSALGLYESCINGRRVGDQELAPGWTDFAKRVRYQVYDVTEHLREGANAIGVLLGDGWYCGYLGREKARESYGRRPALLAQLEILHRNGSELRIVSDERWRWHASHILASDIMQGETVDARRDLGAWTEPGYDDAAWAAVDLAEVPAISLDAMSGPPVRAMRELRPVEEPVRRGHPLFAPRWIFDLGQNKRRSSSVTPRCSTRRASSTPRT
jgi:alpha-L-rhamnosidase